ncbi:hypothetical protein PHYSODRAFT_341722 [Phytophthora sojae]|uniref:Peptidase S1 domain-containing protein n=1 Tax=Phytophthora sojae (strain P6497) TaxID=1094619 RepID=G5AE57_PHYSP|nr:hypothetical protein PHYSODRAFT_341722 [Phytophthora sojae]EGZ06459.1 hypothetical protein PHYSODRAFT_341722 [Phytophthora sojae]|eukprot:XP_009538356.1 hypothetical protein PHYSODRAFT_341722 [Phytophthora sojae]
MKLTSILTIASVVFAFVQGGSSYATSPVTIVAPGNNETQAEPSYVYSNLSVSELTPANGSSETIPISPKTTSIVPSGSKTYAAGLRSSAAGNNFCTAALISPTHLLADGEQIKVVAILQHPKSSSANFSSDVAILKLERPSKFKPVALATADDSDVKDGEWAAKMGWDTAGEGTMANELSRANVQLMSNANCAKETTIDDTMLCSRGVANETSCTGDYGGPVVVERPSGDVVVGVVSWGNDCGQPGYPSIYSSVSSARAWIESVASGVCFH